MCEVPSSSTEHSSFSVRSYYLATDEARFQSYTSHSTKWVQKRGSLHRSRKVHHASSQFGDHCARMKRRSFSRSPVCNGGPWSLICQESKMESISSYESLELLRWGPKINSSRRLL